MRIVLLGPPGTGKGSLALLCHQRLGLAHVSAGQIFRDEMARHSALGRRVKGYVTNGRLVPDALVVEVMSAHLRRLGRRVGFVLDGFPRTRRQAIGLDRVLRRRRQGLDGAIYLASPASVLVRRLSGRLVCERCGANYHVRTMRPKRAGLCDQCGGALVTRKDDQPATIRKRLAIDHHETAPLLQYYQSQGLLYRLNGAGHIETVFTRAMQLFRRLRWVKNESHHR